MTIELKLPDSVILKPKITVCGVGGAGGNAVNNMISANLQGANFVVANTDAQALEHSLSDKKIQLGLTTTRGLGAGASPEVGQAAAQESEEEIREHLIGSNMVFIAAGMGGGTGTGAAPVVARIAKDLGILTLGIVTKPFDFEGKYRMKLAEQGLAALQKIVDTLIVIPNQNLFRIANERTTFADAFKMADDVLHAGVRSITDLMIMPGLINLDFADIRTVMSEMGKAMMGTGEASGEERAIHAAEAAISNPLLDHCSMRGARGVLINITGGMDMTLFEVDAAANRIRQEVGENDANIIFGSTFNPDLDGIIRVSVVATGIDADIVAKEKAISAAATATAKAASASHNVAPEAINQAYASIYQSSDQFRPDAISPQGFSAVSSTTGTSPDVMQQMLHTINAQNSGQSIAQNTVNSGENSVPQVDISVSDYASYDSTIAASRNDQHSNEEVQGTPRYSLFGRMLNSLRGGAPVAEKRQPEMATTNVEVQDTPSFLRKR